MKEKTIKVCRYCKTPLIWTFCFAYNEYYCLNCGGKSGMLGGGDDVKLTTELKLKQSIVEAIWKQLYGKGWLLPPGSYGLSKCKVMENCHNHNDHLSKREIERNEVATKMLEQVKNIFDLK